MGEYYDAAVSGADPVDQRPGFAEMLLQLAANGAKTIIVESPDRFARDLAVQLAGHDMLKALGIAIVPASDQHVGLTRHVAEVLAPRLANKRPWHTLFPWKSNHIAIHYSLGGNYCLRNPDSG